jgi:pyruvate-ferredoxin/flavodoxin oxidoreductase
VTVSHLRFGPEPLTSSYLVNEADYLGIHLQSYLTKYDCLSRLKPGGVLVLNATWKSIEVSLDCPGRPDCRTAVT